MIKYLMENPLKDLPGFWQGFSRHIVLAGIKVEKSG